MSQTADSTLIGRITDVQGNRFTARLIDDSREFSPWLSIGNQHLLIGQVGSYVSIRQLNIYVLARISRIYEDPPLSVAEAPEGSRHGTRSLALIPLGEIDSQRGFRCGVTHYPTIGAAVYLGSLDELKAVFAKYASFRYYFGNLLNYPELMVSINPTALFSRHFAVLGQSGAGKSWTVATMLQRAVTVMPNAHVILLDLHGEYCWRDDAGELHSVFPEGTYRQLDAHALEIPYWLMTFAELVDLLIDRSDAGASIQTAFLRDSLYSLKKRSAEELGLRNVSIDAPIYFPLSEIFETFKAANEDYTDFGKARGPLCGQFDEFLIKLQSRLSDVRYDFLLKPKHRARSDTLSDLLSDFVGLGEPGCQITVVDLSPVPFDVRPTVTAQIGRLAFEFNYWNPQNRQFPLLLVCEEAHAYIPREQGTQYDGARRSMERISKEGRKYGVGLGVVTQRPNELSETVLSQCGTFICMRMTNPDDQVYVRQLIPEAESDLINILPALARGEAIIMGDSAPLPTRLQILKPNPPPNSSDVNFHAHWRKGLSYLDVDDIVDSWRRQHKT